MSPTRSRWHALREDIDGQRRASAHTVTDLSNAIVCRLKTLGTKGHCSRQAIGWLQMRKADGKGAGATKIDFKGNADGRDAWRHPAVRLNKLTHLEDAVLTVSIDVDGRRSGILGYTVSIEGTQRAGVESSEARRWYARVDLTEAPAGQGLCGHPLLHCHVGVDPEPNEKFSARVPLPWLHPADALDWLLATVEPALEPRMER